MTDPHAPPPPPQPQHPRSIEAIDRTSPGDPPLGPAAIGAPWRLPYLEGLTKEEKEAVGLGVPNGPAATSSTVGRAATGNSVGGAGVGAGGGMGGGVGGGVGGGRPSSGSFLLDYWLAPERDEPNHVIVRTGAGMILLNAFPYAPGHLLVALGEARPSLTDYAREQRATLFELVSVATELMERTLEPQGINTGINQGRAAGAGIPQHLHVHLVPRWGGDTNFITVVGQIRVLPASLDAMASRYREVWARMR